MKIRNLTIFCAALMFISCNQGTDYSNETDNYSMKNKDFNILKGKVVLFGHQSVGNNIIQGLSKIVTNEAELNFVKITPFEEFISNNKISPDSLYIIHFRVGTNKFPYVKLEDFEEKFNQLEKIDVALMKFCYADVGVNTNLDKLLAAYKDTMLRLQKKNPNTSLLYTTIPVTSKSKGIKNVIKKLIGKKDNNISRYKLNRKIRDTAEDKLFDIALIETNDENKNTYKNAQYLDDDLTYDGGHLNELGSRILAMELIKTLDNILNND